MTIEQDRHDLTEVVTRSEGAHPASSSDGIQPPLTSVVIVAYNQERWIEEAIRSAVDQDYPNIEVVVADDNSTDGTRAIIQRLATEHPATIVPVLGDTNVGVTRNCNRALAVCRGKYVAFLGGDDVCLPGKIAAQVGWLEAGTCRVLCGHDVWFIDEAGNRIELASSRRPLRARGSAEDVIRSGAPCNGASVMVRRSAIPAGGFDDRIRTHSDIKLFIDCLASGGEYGNLPTVYAHYRKRTGSLTWRAGADAAVAHAAFEDNLMTLTLVEGRWPRYAAVCRRARGLAFANQAWRRIQRGQCDEARLYARSALTQYLWGNWYAWISLWLSYLPSSVARFGSRLHNWIYNHSPALRRVLATHLGAW